MIVHKYSTTITLAAMISTICTHAIAQSDTICLTDQRFSRVDFYSVGEHPGQVELADLDQDGDLDAVVLNRAAGSFTVLLGDPSGIFTFHTEIPTGQLPTAQEFDDIDHDGDIDLLIVDAETDEIVIFLNDGNAGFVEHSRVGVGERSRSIKVADFNNDGYSDIACTHHRYLIDDPTVEILLGGPNITFAEPFGLFDDMHTNDVSIADFNNDGNADIAALEGIYPGGNRGRIYLGNGDATFDEPIQFNSRRSTITSMAEDMNNDGHLDIVSVSRIESSVIIHYGDGTGAFNDDRQIPLLVEAANVATAYLNDDDLLDIVVSYDGVLSSEGGGISLLESRSNGSFRLIFVPNTGLSSWVAVADLNADGKTDFVAPARGTDTLEVVFDQCGVCPADLNGDGMLNFFDVDRLLNPAPGANIFLDYNLDGVTNFFDISDFLNDFQIGCN